MYLCARGSDFASFQDLSIESYNCSDHVVFFYMSFYYFFIELDVESSGPVFVC